jgi:hypothetical protein
MNSHGVMTRMVSHRYIDKPPRLFVTVLYSDVLPAFTHRTESLSSIHSFIHSFIHAPAS